MGGGSGGGGLGSVCGGGEGGRETYNSEQKKKRKFEEFHFGGWRVPDGSSSFQRGSETRRGGAQTAMESWIAALH